MTEKVAPPDLAQRLRALDTAASVLIEAPAGSGKTELLTRRFLALLAEVEEPGEILAITFTRAAAAEMRNRILGALEAAASPQPPDREAEAGSLEALAARAFAHSERMGWRILDLPAQLRISTIDSFCAELATRLPLLTGLGTRPRIEEQADDLYRDAARRTLARIDGEDPLLRAAVENLLRWRDNNWEDLEGLLVKMLSTRDKWMHQGLLDRETDWDALRGQLERPLRKASIDAVQGLKARLDRVPGAEQTAAALAAFALSNGGEETLSALAQAKGIPDPRLPDEQSIQIALEAALGLAELALTKGNEFRARIVVSNGFPPTATSRKKEWAAWIDQLKGEPDMLLARAKIRS